MASSLLPLPGQLKTVSRTFLEVFPDASLWLSGENDLILLGWKEKHSTQALGTIRKRIRESSGIAEAARFFGIQPAEGLLSGYILGPVELRAYSGKGPFHTDDHPILEYSSPRSFFFPTVSYSNLREIAGFKSSSFPPFVTVAESERADTHHRIGMNLLIRNRWGGAKREFSMASSRARDPGGIPEVSTAEWIPFVGPSSDIRESFEGEMMRLPLIPRLGVFRPDDAEAEDLSSWLSSMEEFTVASGIAAGAGVGGGNGLVIRGVAGVASSGYFSPLRVNPSTSYTVEFAMKSNLEEGGEAGVGILEYDDPSLPGVEPTQAVNARHLVGAHDAVRIRGERDWKAISFTFRTSPRTRMVHLLFYREGKSDRDIVAFDDIIVRRFR